MGRPALKFCNKHQLEKKKIGKGYYCLECKKEAYRDDKLNNPDKYLNATEKLKRQIPTNWNEETIVKVCNIHGELRLKDVRYLNPNNMRCKECAYERSRISRDKNRDEYNASIREKRKNDPDYAEYKRRQSRTAQRKRYVEKNEHMKAVAKAWRDRNPEKQKNFAYKTRYGITFDEYKRLFELQNGVCKICKEPETALDNFGKEGKVLSVDHCHDSKIVRGLLCSRCNCMIGYSRESEEILEAGKVYLREFNDGVSKSCSQKKC